MITRLLNLTGHPETHTGPQRVCFCVCVRLCVCITVCVCERWGHQMLTPEDSQVTPLHSCLLHLPCVLPWKPVLLLIAMFFLFSYWSLLPFVLLFTVKVETSTFIIKPENTHGLLVCHIAPFSLRQTSQTSQPRGLPGRTDHEVCEVPCCHRRKSVSNWITDRWTRDLRCVMTNTCYRGRCFTNATGVFVFLFGLN